MSSNPLRNAWVRAHAFISENIAKNCLFCQKLFFPIRFNPGFNVDRYAKCLFCSHGCSEKYIHRAFTLLAVPRAVAPEVQYVRSENALWIRYSRKREKRAASAGK